MNIVVSFFSQVPIYEQIQNQIKELVLTGDLKPGEALPSMRLMAKDLKVSLITVRRAYEELEHEGVITTLHGRGCFVSDINVDKIKEINMNMLKERLEEIVVFSKTCGISKEEFKNMLDEMYEVDK
ncbi:GntR family transcriptional regulator [Clostridium sp. YIM B02515]|uniref:GntR family transcriptional regulator n=1 Tax=Clostridium rhizosphaerae TaxID=2803861 RepID=A0ABS1TD92_9CLOT|nr:GntR family transcriptional regulator [Clostridium rhizosphaerae]MBL4937337.1 GntR family transcriptional regulator [Clostridium rhizosphaerae]